MIVTEEFSFVLNPKAASSSIAAALHLRGYRVEGERHAVRPTSPSIRAVVHRDDGDRLESGWRQWCKNGASLSAWLDGEPFEVADGVDFKRTPQSYWTDGATHILRFTHLKEDWRALCDLLGLRSNLLHLNRSVL